MIEGLTAGYVALGGRVLLLAAIQPLMKALNQGRSAVVVAMVFTGFGGILSLVPATISVIHNPAQLATIPEWIYYSVGGGAVFTVGVVSFNRALRVGDVSLLSPLTALSFILVYVFDLILRNTSFALLPLIGIGTVMVGMIVLNLRPGIPFSETINPLSVLRQPGAGGALVFALTLAFARVIDKAGMATAPAFLYSVSGHFVVAVIAGLIVVWRRQLFDAANLVRERLSLALWVSALGVGNYLCLLVAYRFFAPSMIEPVSQLGMVLTVFIGVIAFKEPLHLRWLAAIMIAAGASLVVLGR